MVISLTISPASTLIGATTCTTKNGFCNIDTARNKYAGTYQIIISVSVSGYSSLTSKSFTVTGNTAFTSIVLTSSNASPSLFSSFTISVIIYDSTSSIKTDSCSFSLSESGGSTISGTTSGTITGSDSFSISFTTIGSKTIDGTCGSITGSVSVTVIKFALKISTFTPVKSI